MGETLEGWVAARTLGGRVCEFEWRVDEAGGAWHPLGGSSHAVSAGAHGDGIGLFLHQTLGWTIYAAGTAVHLAAIFTSAGLWEWNGRKKGMEFRQLDAGRGRPPRSGGAVAEGPSVTRLTPEGVDSQRAPGCLESRPSGRSPATERREATASFPDRLRAAYEQRLAEADEPEAPAARKGTHPRAPFSLGARFRALSKGLQARVEEFEAGGRHAAEKGQRREAAVRDFLATHLPDRYGVTRGEAVAPIGETSLQMDALIYDRPNAPVLMDSGGSRLLAVESVYAAIEVKPRLILPELRKAVDNIQSVKALSPALYIGPDAGVPIFGAIFAFESVDRRLLASQLHELQADVPPGLHVDAICILGSAYLYRNPGGGLSAWTPQASLSSIPLCAVPAGDDSLFLFYHHLLRDLRHKTLPFPHLEPYTGPLDLPPPEFL